MASDPHEARRRHQLQQVAEGLRDLHRQLMNEARRDYEQEIGAIVSAPAFLQLLMTDPYFRWLRSLSSAMADLDDLLDQHEALTHEQARGVGLRFDSLVTGQTDAYEFSERYRGYLQKSADLVIAHAAVRLALRPLT